MEENNVQPVAEPPPPCPTCGRVERYCVCNFTQPITTKTKILILQHPQEPGVDISTVPIIKVAFPNSAVKTGLSWPNLKKVLGYEVEHQRWGVLYLGSVHVENLPKDRNLFVVDKKGTPLINQDAILHKLEGIVILDGTWSQAKTLWWRNAWLLKLQRLVLRPSKRSLYDRIRKEPRKGCLSTLETVGEAISLLEERPDIQELLQKPLIELVSRLEKNRPAGNRGASRKDWRRRGQPRQRNSVKRPT